MWVSHMYTGNKSSFACEFTIHVNVKYKVALDRLESNNNISLSSILWRQAFFPLKCTSYFQHILFNWFYPGVSTHILACMYCLIYCIWNTNSKLVRILPVFLSKHPNFAISFICNISHTHMEGWFVFNLTIYCIFFPNIAYFRPLNLSVKARMLIHTSTHLKFPSSNGLLGWRVPFFRGWPLDTDP